MTIVPSFDLIACVKQAYSLLWAERAYILRLALVPFFIKIICYTLGYYQGGDENMLHLTLYMVPAWLVEGWMLAHVARLVILGQRWPFQPSGNIATDLPVLQHRYRGVMGGLIAFALIQMLIGGWFAMLLKAVPISLDAPPEALSLESDQALAAFLLLGAGLYAFRFLWLFIPAAAGAALEPIVRILSRGGGMSFRLIGVWIMCSLPGLLVMQILIGFILMLLGPDMAAQAMMQISIVAKVIFDMVKNLLCAIAMAYAFLQMFGKQARP